MDKIPLVIGFRLDKALQLLGGNQSLIIESTSTPYDDKIEERQGNTPIVVRQKATSEGIKLTTSLFK